MRTRRFNSRPGSTIRKSSADRRGATVVEFALVAPLMILLTMGMMEFGRVLMVEQMLADAAREGARLASLPETTASQVLAQVNQQLSDLSVPGATVTTSPSDFSSITPGTQVTVQISVPAANISWIPNPVFTLYKTLEAETTMRREGE